MQPTGVKVLPQQLTVSKTIYDPQFCEYNFTWLLYVDCDKCGKFANICKASGGNGNAAFKCNSCGWHEVTQLNYDLLVSRLSGHIR